MKDEDMVVRVNCHAGDLTQYKISWQLRPAMHYGVWLEGIGLLCLRRCQDRNNTQGKKTDGSQENANHAQSLQGTLLGVANFESESASITAKND